MVVTQGEDGKKLYKQAPSLEDAIQVRLNRHHPLVQAFKMIGSCIPIFQSFSQFPSLSGSMAGPGLAM